MSSAGPFEPRLRVALDTTYAGVNTTGVGLYSSRLASELRNQAREMSLDITCFGSACKPAGARHNAIATFQEWPTYTHAILPTRLLAARPQIVHSTSHIGPLWGPGKLIVTVHDLIFMRYPQDYQRGWLAITKALLPLVLRRAKAVIVDSRATGQDAQEFFGVSARKIAVIYPGIDPPESLAVGNAFAQRSGDEHPLPGGPYILCLGPWVRRKNLEVVVKAFALLASDFDEMSLVITGDTPRGMKGYTRDDLFGLLPARFHSRLHLVGYVSLERRNALVSGALALCYPSRFEGFGLPPLEAMAAGVPVIASDTPAVAEVTAGAALLADPDDATAWAQSLRRLWDEPLLAEQVRRDGIRRSAEFTWYRCALRTARLYKQIAQRKSVKSFT